MVGDISGVNNKIWIHFPGFRNKKLIRVMVACLCAMGMPHGQYFKFVVVGRGGEAPSIQVLNLIEIFCGWPQIFKGSLVKMSFLIFMVGFFSKYRFQGIGHWLGERCNPTNFSGICIEAGQIRFYLDIVFLARFNIFCLVFSCV